MIRLTVKAASPLSQPEIHLFNKTSILIGSDQGHADLVLKNSDILPHHIKIVESSGAMIVINLENDPLASLNHLPFGKKILQSGDVITLHDIDISYESLSSNEPESAPKIEAPSIHSSEIEAFKDEEWQAIDLNAILNSLESEPPKPAPEPLKRTSLKDDYLRDLDDNPENEERHREPSHLVQAWKWILIFIVSLSAFTALFGSVIYLTLSDKTEKQEVKAAQGVADLAMALTHAQLYHINPPNQNWGDIEFLKENLQTLLPETDSYASHLDAQGQFTCCPYTLRIYTNATLSRFLLIAQPAPSLIYWLIPKATLVVDSQTLELRAIKNVQVLNRLLANPNPLDGVNGKEITAVLKAGQLTTLPMLAAESGIASFLPPQALMTKIPGSENHIYFAPRYYLLSRGLVDKALALATKRGTRQDVAELQEEVTEFEQLQNYVIYMQQDERTARLIKRSLSTFAPSEKLLFGALQVDEKGEIASADLIDESEDGSDLALLSPEDDENEENPVTGPIKAENLDTNPLYLDLQSLAAEREQELRPLAAAVNQAITQELHQPSPLFRQEFKRLALQLLRTDNKLKKKLKIEIARLREQYQEVPSSQFDLYLHRLNLDLLDMPPVETPPKEVP